MICIDHEALQASDKKYIRFPNLSERYQSMFLVEDGKNLLFHDNFNHETRPVPCTHIGSHHFNFGTTCFHIDQFAELMHRNGHTYEPETFVTDLSVYQRYFADRQLKDKNDKIIPYHVLIGKGDLDRYGKPEFLLVFCPEADKDRQFALIHHGQGGIPAANRFCSAHDIEQSFSESSGVIAFPALSQTSKDCLVGLTECEQRFVTAVIKAQEREKAPSLNALIDSAKSRTETNVQAGPVRTEQTH